MEGSGRRLPSSALGYSDGGSTAARACGPCCACTPPRALSRDARACLTSTSLSFVDAREGINRCSSGPVSAPRAVVGRDRRSMCLLTRDANALVPFPRGCGALQMCAARNGKGTL